VQTIQHRRTRKSAIATTLGLALSAAVLLDACTANPKATSAGTPIAASSSSASVSLLGGSAAPLALNPTSDTASSPAAASHTDSATASPSSSVTGSADASATAASQAPRSSRSVVKPTVRPPAKSSASAVPAAVVAPKPTPIPPKVAAPPAPIIARPGGEPGPGNTGVPPGTKLAVINGDVDVTTNGQVIDGADIKGALVIRASNVVVRRSLIEGRHGEDSVLVQSGSGIVFQDDEITVGSPSVASDDMHVSGVTLTRLNIHGGVDGIKLGANSTVTASWIHGLSAFASDPVQGGGATHNDAIQIMGGGGIQVTANNLQASTHDNSAVQVTQDTGSVSGLVLSRNWADGGGCTFNISGHGPGGKLLTMSGITLSGNRFGHASRFGCPVLIDNQTTFAQSGNVYNDTGLPVEIKIHN
jgi:hypothetical protein